LNWFTFGKVITKIKRVNFLLRHSAEYVSLNNVCGKNVEEDLVLITERETLM